jgi:hypothetical protein
MTAPAFSLAVGERRRLLVELDGSYAELVGTVTAVRPATINFRTEDGRVLCLYRRQVLAAGPAEQWVDPSDPLRHCQSGRVYEFYHHGPSGITRTRGVLLVAGAFAVLVDTGAADPTVLARSSILFAPEVSDAQAA